MASHASLTNLWMPRWHERTDFHMHAMARTDRHADTLIIIITVITIFLKLEHTSYYNTKIPPSTVPRHSNSSYSY